MSIWSEIRNILLVVDYTSIDDLKNYRTVLKNSGLNINDCTILTIVQTKKERLIMREISSVSFIAHNDFNFIGRLKNEEATKVLNHRYDAVVCIRDPYDKIFKLLRSVKKNWLIGINCDKENYNIKLTSLETEPQHLFNFVTKTLEKIN